MLTLFLLNGNNNDEIVNLFLKHIFFIHFKFMFESLKPDHDLIAWCRVQAINNYSVDINLSLGLNQLSMSGK